MKKVVLSGMRPTGKLHLGHWVGALSNWVSLQSKYDCFFMVADWHALMSEYHNPRVVSSSIVDNVADWLCFGVDPEKSVVFIQSEVEEHLELYLILSLITPLGWLSRCPTFKEQVQQLKDKDVNTYAFLGYPALQAADIILYKADAVPVGEDQLPHLELTREIIRRFHFIYKKDIFIEPQPLLTAASRLLGLDGRKMSKSYDNFISLDEEEDSLAQKITSMITDPARIKKSDCGHPEVCNVYSYYEIFAPEKKDEVYKWCTNAERGCKECKLIFAKILNEFIAPRRDKKEGLLKKKNYILDVLEEGKKKAKAVAAKTLGEAKKAMGL